jgi:ubiquinone/menaquinone biosynthesis C-methylase UbiE
MDNKPNFGSVARDYALWRNDFPKIVLDQLIEKGLKINRSKIVDLGCGTGIICRALVEKGAEVVGVEPSEELLGEAIAIDNEQGLSIKYVKENAEETYLPSHTFDGVTVVRAWHWFERSKVLPEIKRILKAKGHLCIIDSAFVPSKSKVARDTLEIIRKYTPNGVLKPAGSKAETKERKNGFPACWFNEWEQAGFKLIDSWQLDYEVSFTHEGWRGRVRSLSWIAEFDFETRKHLDAELDYYLRENHPHEPIVIPHECSVVFLGMI